ncbi:unnamed protein product [Schistosoma margrebowiei]|uniref:Uncharacterized protein n=1 Tax=Schistosoma margrebowiei TaxID=48269 RepID=A0A183MJI2_9TREM|nr:unnamed protein product [Schistosoma margrebowiei]
MVVENSQRKTLDLVFVLLGIRPQEYSKFSSIYRLLLIFNLTSFNTFSKYIHTTCMHYDGKSKILRYNTTCTNPITIDGEDLEDVKTFTYLGSIIDEHDGSDADVKARIGKARAAYLQMKNI